MSEVAKHQIKIYYNPFLKNIEVERLTDQNIWKKWMMDPTEQWNISQNSALQNVALVLLREINDKYNTGKNGMQIEFFGTAFDFTDLADALARLQKENSLANAVELTHNQEDVLPTGEDAKNKVDFHYEKMKKIVDASNLGSVKVKISKYKDVSKPAIKICIIGNYSTGKSTFLNAVLGRDILPSATDPTTAKNVSICHSEEMNMCFRYGDDDISIIWDSNTHKYKYSEAGPAEFKKSIDKSIADEADMFRQVYTILKTLNEISDEKLSPDIELKLPFANDFFATSAVEYVFIDTPGSNSAEKKSAKHKEILAHAFEDKTSALPVILVERNSLFSRDNKELDDALQSDGVELDIPNKLFLISMADKINLPTLSGDLKNDALRNVLKEKDVDCVLYFSALIALGVQADLHDASYQSDYETYKSRFSTNTEKEFRNLEKFAILPDLLSDLRDTPEASGEIHECLKNSGMLLFQRILDNFAKKYSYYSKAETCRKLLLDAMMDVEKEQSDALSELKEIERCYEEDRIRKRNELISEIMKKPDFSKQYTEIVKQAHEKFESRLTAFRMELLPEATRQWDAVKGKKAKGEEKTAECHKHMVHSCNVEYHEQFNKVKTFYEGKFTELAEGHKNNIINLINEDKQLSEDTKKLLISIDTTEPAFAPTYTEYKLNKNAFSKVFLFWGEKINPQKYASVLKDDFSAKFLSDCVTKPGSDFSRTLDQWIADLQKKYTFNIDSESIALKDFDKKIAECREKISSIDKICKDLAGSKCELERITTFKKEARP